jgi:hypothetical protein
MGGSGAGQGRSPVESRYVKSTLKTVRVCETYPWAADFLKKRQEIPSFWPKTV